MVKKPRRKLPCGLRDDSQAFFCNTAAILSA